MHKLTSLSLLFLAVLSAQANESLYKAVNANNVSEVQRLLSEDPTVDVNWVHRGDWGIGIDSITQAVWGNHLEIFEILIRHPKLEIKKLPSINPLLPFAIDHHSTGMSYRPIITGLLKYYQSKEGTSSPSIIEGYITSIIHGDIPVLKEILELPGFNARLGIPDVSPLYALTLSIRQSQELAQILISRAEFSSADLNLGMAQLIYMAGVRPGTAGTILSTYIKSSKVDMNAKTRIASGAPSLSAIHQAQGGFWHSTEIFDILLAQPGIDTNSMTDNGQTVLMKIADAQFCEDGVEIESQRDIRIVKALLAYPGTRVDLRDNSSKSALDYAKSPTYHSSRQCDISFQQKLIALLAGAEANP